MLFYLKSLLLDSLVSLESYYSFLEVLPQHFLLHEVLHDPTPSTSECEFPESKPPYPAFLCCITCQSLEHVWHMVGTLQIVNEWMNYSLL